MQKGLSLPIVVVVGELVDTMLPASRCAVHNSSSFSPGGKIRRCIDVYAQMIGSLVNKMMARANDK